MHKVHVILAAATVVLLTLTVFSAFNNGSISFSKADSSQTVAKEIVVPTDYLTLAAAVGNASQGATIYVKAGTYQINNSLTINKTLTLIGENQTGTILETPPDTRIGFEFFVPKLGLRVAADGCVISNFTITNCDFGVSATGDHNRIYNITSGSVSVRGSHCLIAGNNLTDPGVNPLNVYGAFNEVTANLNAHINIQGDNNSATANVGGSIDITGNNNTVLENTGLLYITLTNSNQNLLLHNSCNEIDLVGIRGSHNNTVSGNLVEGGKTVWGILMGNGSGNIFFANNITGYAGVSQANGHHYGYGVAVGGFEYVAEKNLFYCNNFMQNYKHVSANWEILGVGNSWDNGTCGNYWDDYTGVDRNGDRLGDTPYVVNGSSGDTNGNHYSHVFGEDHYPLIALFNTVHVSSELPTTNAPIEPTAQPTQNTPQISEFLPALTIFATLVAVVASASLVYYCRKHKNH